MQKTICSVLLAAGVMLAMNSAADAAQNYSRGNWFWNYHNERWCLTENESMAPDCGYRTFQDCNYSRNGTGGTCGPNPRYVEQAPSRKRKKVSR